MEQPCMTWSVRYVSGYMNMNPTQTLKHRFEITVPGRCIEAE